MLPNILSSLRLQRHLGPPPVLLRLPRFPANIAGLLLFVLRFHAQERVLDLLELLFLLLILREGFINFHVTRPLPRVSALQLNVEWSSIAQQCDLP